MKYKYPKKITIGQTVFHIKYDKKSDDGAKFRYPHKNKRAYIEFGMRNHEANPLAFLGTLIHELKEIIQIEQSTRMFVRGNNSYIFHYTHQQHDDLCGRLAELLTQFIK